MKLLYSPFTQEQVYRINALQWSGFAEAGQLLGYPLMCITPEHGPLAALLDGMMCLKCYYTQYYVFDFTAKE